MKSLAAMPKMLMSLIVLGLIIVGAFLFMIKGLEFLANLDALKYQQTALAIARMISKDPKITDKPFVINSTKCNIFSIQVGEEINNMIADSKLVAKFMIFNPRKPNAMCQGGLEGITSLIKVSVPLFIDDKPGYLDLILGEKA